MKMGLNLRWSGLAGSCLRRGFSGTRKRVEKKRGCCFGIGIGIGREGVKETPHIETLWERVSAEDRENAMYSTSTSSNSSSWQLRRIGAPHPNPIYLFNFHPATIYASRHFLQNNLRISWKDVFWIVGFCLLAWTTI